MYSIGDLVMATALDISHPALSKKEIDKSYHFLVSSRITASANGWMDWMIAYQSADHDNLIVNWMPIEINGKRYQDEKYGNPNYFDVGTYFNIYVAFEFIHKIKVKLIVGVDNTNMTKIHSVVEEMIKKKS